MTTMNQGNTNRPGVTPAGTAASQASPIMQRNTSPLSNAATGITPKFIPTLSEDDAVVQARLLKALADPTRLRILSLLSRHEGEVCVFEIVESFTLEQPTISHHLRILRDAGLVDCRKKGLWAYYYVRRDALTRAQSVIEDLA
jgi:ArsR family transcriptional regulator